MALWINFKSYADNFQFSFLKDIQCLYTQLLFAQTSSITNVRMILK